MQVHVGVDRLGYVKKKDHRAKCGHGSKLKDMGMAAISVRL